MYELLEIFSGGVIPKARAFTSGPRDLARAMDGPRGIPRSA